MPIHFSVVIQKSAVCIVDTRVFAKCDMNAQMIIWSENFETHGRESRYASSFGHYIGINDYFGQIRSNGIYFIRARSGDSEEYIRVVKQ